jgi:hypothetical protein
MSRFVTAGIRESGAQITTTSADWDAIWQGVYTQLKNVAGGGLDAASGGVLDQRNVQYDSETASFRTDMGRQATAHSEMADLATQTGTSMVNRIGGGAV